MNCHHYYTIFFNYQKGYFYRVSTLNSPKIYLLQKSSFHVMCYVLCIQSAKWNPIFCLIPCTSDKCMWLFICYIKHIFFVNNTIIRHLPITIRRKDWWTRHVRPSGSKSKVWVGTPSSKLLQPGNICSLSSHLHKNKFNNHNEIIRKTTREYQSYQLQVFNQFKSKGTFNWRPCNSDSFKRRAFWMASSSTNST